MAGWENPAPATVLDPLAVALGLKGWTYPTVESSNTTAPTSQTIYGVAAYIPPGNTVTGLAMCPIASASGLKPAGFFVGIASASKMLAQSADLSGNAGVPFAAAGLEKLPFSAPYVANVADSPTGLYYLCFLQNGAWGTTNPTFGRGSGVPLDATYLPYATGGLLQTNLPANGAAIAWSPAGTPLGWQLSWY